MRALSFTRTPTPGRDKENRTLFREIIEIAKEIWTNEYFSYEGENFTFPAAETRVQASPVPTQRQCGWMGTRLRSSGLRPGPTRSRTHPFG